MIEKDEQGIIAKNLLGQRLLPGDFVVWPVKHGSNSASLSSGIIEKIEEYIPSWSRAPGTTRLVIKRKGQDVSKYPNKIVRVSNIWNTVRVTKE